MNGSPAPTSGPPTWARGSTAPQPPAQPAGPASAGPHHGPADRAPERSAERFPERPYQPPKLAYPAQDQQYEPVERGYRSPEDAGPVLQGSRPAPPQRQASTVTPPEVVQRPLMSAGNTLAPMPVQPPPPVREDQNGYSRNSQPQPPQRPLSALSREGVCWVGAHGGAGTSTLATVLGGVDVGCRWPDPVKAEPGRVILVARTHASGMRAASRALNALREGRHPEGMELLALVLIADAPGRLPLALTRRIRVLRSAVPVRRIPWISAWRLGKPAKDLPRALARVAALAGVQQQAMEGRR